MHFVYIVRCADGTLYTGYARDPRARERAHNSGRGAKYTAGRRPVLLVYPRLQPAQVAAVYRDRRRSFEAKSDEPGAADFYYGEMEMRRRCACRRTEASSTRPALSTHRHGLGRPLARSRLEIRRMTITHNEYKKFSELTA